MRSKGMTCPSLRFLVPEQVFSRDEETSRQYKRGISTHGHRRVSKWPRPPATFRPRSETCRQKEAVDLCRLPARKKTTRASPERLKTPRRCSCPLRNERSSPKPLLPRPYGRVPLHPEVTFGLCGQGQPYSCSSRGVLLEDVRKISTALSDCPSCSSRSAALTASLRYFSAQAPEHYQGGCSHRLSARTPRGTIDMRRCAPLVGYTVQWRS